jgi:hypothetical protein
MAGKTQGSKRQHPQHTAKTAPAAGKAAVTKAHPPRKPPMYSKRGK